MRADTLLARVRAELGEVRLVPRASLPWYLRPFIGGARYAGFATTIGRTIYTPIDWEERGDQSRYELLRHEVVHLRQFRHWPFRALARGPLWRLNAVLVGVLYLAVLPVLWTFRARFEREAYAQTMLVAHEDGRLGDLGGWATTMLEHFCGGEYAWMDRRGSTLDWTARTYAEIASGGLTNPADRVPPEAP